MGSEEILQIPAAEKKSEIEEKKPTTTEQEAVQMTAHPVRWASFIGGQASFWNEFYARPEEKNSPEKLRTHGKPSRAGDLFTPAHVARMRDFLDDNEGMKKLTELYLHPGDYVPVAARERCAIDAVEMLIQENNNFVQVIDIGAGSSSILRGLKTDFPHLNCFETDLGDTLSKKESVLKSKNKETGSQYIAGDFKNDNFWNEVTKEKSKTPDFTKDTIILMIGLVQYVKDPLIFQKRLAEIKAKAKGEIRLVFDYPTSAMTDATKNKSIKETTETYQNFKKQGADASTTFDNMEKLLSDAGFHILSEKSISKVIQEYGLGDNPQASTEYWKFCMASNKAPTYTQEMKL